MTELSPGTRAVTIQKKCGHCDHFGLVASVFTQGPPDKFRTRRNVEYKRPVLVGQECPDCGVCWDVKTVLQKAPKESKPVRDDRVQAIKRLKAAGYRFSWEKVAS